ncbi:MAG: hypothetical protein CSA18_02525 [Deltaproteobacteria bacterium]|nr:MAG: hypothetical protein CSB21_00940 [Deltaproteobacteria bacterium]PIE75003.1 MAG: hypothetical protein CSA18_02525 [Deltaproteobacteria bacterium]
MLNFLLVIPALAKEKTAMQIETITVTAQKREGKIQDIPSSVSVVSDVQLDDLKMDSVKNISALIPNFYVTDTGADQSFASMRGIGASMAGAPTVGIYVDDVYTTFGLDLILMDVERVEVLRGPQGTLYGRNSEAGVINVVTKKPGKQWDGKLFADIGSFNSYQGSAVFSGPIGEKIGLRASLQYGESDGWFENKFNGSDEGGRKEEFNGRLHFSLAASENLNFQLIYDICRRKNPNYANFAFLDQPGKLRKNINVDYMGEAKKNVDTLSLHGRYDFGSYRIVSITSFDKVKAHSANDIDLMPMDMMNLDIHQEIETFSQEFRLMSADKNSPFTWLVGAFLLHENRDTSLGMWMNFMNMGMGMPGESLKDQSDSTTTSGAIFGEATYTFADRFHLTLGLRYDREEQEFDHHRHQPGPVLSMMGKKLENISKNGSHEAWLPKAALRYDLTKGISPYVSMARGFRSGGYNALENLGAAFAPEFTWNYEAGIKTSFLDHRLQCNAAVFYIDWTDMQVEVPTAGGSAFYMNNAAEASTKGFELEIAARPLPGVELFAGMGYIKAEYESYSVGPNIYDGNTIVDVPEMTFHLGGVYRHDSGFFASLLYRYVGDVTIDVANTQKQEDYGLLSGKIGYEGDSFDVYVYARNIFNEEYTTRQFNMQDAWGGRAGEPLVVGTNITFRF